eukprot:scaffold13.g183.t1
MAATQLASRLCRPGCAAHTPASSLHAAFGAPPPPGAAPPGHAVAARAAAVGRTSLPSLPAGGLGSIADLRELRELRGEADAGLSDLQLRDVAEISYVSRRRLDSADFDPNEVDEASPCWECADGLPLVYNEQAIAAYWRGRPGDLASRWTKFAGVSLPWLTKLANAFLQGRIQARGAGWSWWGGWDPGTQAGLARDAVDNLERLGPTFIKLGQIMSIRPDVLPPAVMGELAKLQDRIEPFPTDAARAVVEAELGAPIEQLFSEFSEEPIAAASLAQVYRARLRATGAEVAVKVQRPQALATISKDLYVLRRAAGVYERLAHRFTAQTTDYQRLVSTFAEGLYTEMAATLEIPFSVPPYMSLLARSVATLEGIALVSQAYPFVARRVLRADPGTAPLLRELLHDPATGGVRAARLPALLNAALGYVAEETDGFVDFDAMPEQGASLQEVLGFLLSPEARDLRPLLLAELTNTLDLFLRDRLRRAAAAAPALLRPRLPLPLPLAGALPLPALPAPPAPPVPVPGRGWVPPRQLVAELAPPLSQPEEVYLQQVVELAAGLLGLAPADLEAPRPALLLRLLLSPNEQARRASAGARGAARRGAEARRGRPARSPARGRRAPRALLRRGRVRELQQALSIVAGGGGAADPGVVQEMSAQVVDGLMRRAAGRLSVDVDTLFPMRAALLAAAAGR